MVALKDLKEFIRLMEASVGSDIERLKVFLEVVLTTKELVEFPRQNAKDSQLEMT